MAKKDSDFKKRIKLLVLTIPLGVMAVASLVYNRPFIQQALVGITLLYFYVLLIIGSSILG